MFKKILGGIIAFVLALGLLGAMSTSAQAATQRWANVGSHDFGRWETADRFRVTPRLRYASGPGAVAPRVTTLHGQRLDTIGFPLWSSRIEVKYRVIDDTVRRGYGVPSIKVMNIRRTDYHTETWMPRSRKKSLRPAVCITAKQVRPWNNDVHHNFGCKSMY